MTFAENEGIKQAKSGIGTREKMFCIGKKTHKIQSDCLIGTHWVIRDELKGDYNRLDTTSGRIRGFIRDDWANMYKNRTATVLSRLLDFDRKEPIRGPLVILGSDNTPLTDEACNALSDLCDQINDDDIDREDIKVPKVILDLLKKEEERDDVTVCPCGNVLHGGAQCYPCPFLFGDGAFKNNK